MILTGDHTRIIEMIDKLAVEVKALLTAAIEISYYTRGAVSYDQVLNMSAFERDLTIDFVNERLKAASKMPFPVF